VLKAGLLRGFETLDSAQDCAVEIHLRQACWRCVDAALTNGLTALQPLSLLARAGAFAAPACFSFSLACPCRGGRVVVCRWVVVGVVFLSLGGVSCCVRLCCFCVVVLFVGGLVLLWGVCRWWGGSVWGVGVGVCCVSCGVCWVVCCVCVVGVCGCAWWCVGCGCGVRLVICVFCSGVFFVFFFSLGFCPGSGVVGGHLRRRWRSLGAAP